jgi:uncharacterized membrane protein
MKEFIPPRFRVTRYHLMMVISLLIIAIFLVLPPVTLFSKTHAVGYAICHQIPARTLHIGGVPLPLCARCSGIYLGALLGILGAIGLGRQQAVELPPTPVLVLLVGFIGLMGVDGVNSYLTFFPQLPHLYEPQNWLRLTTGTLNGLAMGAIVFPVINGSLWHTNFTKPEASIKSLKELVLFVGGAAAIILIVLWQHPLLLIPLTVLSTAGVMLMLTIVNTMFVLVATHREGCARSWRDVVVPTMMGLAASFLMVGGMNWLRATVTVAAGLPF